MTKLEAEKIYETQVEERIALHKIQIEKYIKQGKRSKRIGNILIVIGLIMLIFAISLSDFAIQVFFIMSCPTVLLFGIVVRTIGVNYNISRSKKGPDNFICENKALYLNYLRCTDISDEDKLYYKQELENIRNIELRLTISSAMKDVSTSVYMGTMFNMINKK